MQIDPVAISRSPLNIDRAQAKSGQIPERQHGQHKHRAHDRAQRQRRLVRAVAEDHLHVLHEQEHVAEHGQEKDGDGGRAGSERGNREQPHVQQRITLPHFDKAECQAQQ